MRKFLMIPMLFLLNTPMQFVSAQGFDNRDSLGKNLQKIKPNIVNILDIVNEYLESLPSEEQWGSIVADIGPLKGNYCGLEANDKSYKSLCLNQLDCICKENTFGYSLRRYYRADPRLAEEIFGVKFSSKTKSAAEHLFLQKMVLAWFAGTISDQNLTLPILEAYNLRETNYKKAKQMLEDLIDVNEVLTEKIKSIQEEKKKFVDFQGKLLFEKSRTMMVTFQPLDFFWGIFSLGYEWKWVDWVSLRTKVSFLGSALITETYLGYRNKKDFSIFAGFGPKLYLIGEALKFGLYLEPWIDVGYESVKYLNSKKAVDIREVGVVPSLVVGLDKVFNSGIQIGAGMGIGCHIGVWVSPDDQLDSSERHFFVPKFYGSIGYAW